MKLLENVKKRIAGSDDEKPKKEKEKVDNDVLQRIGLSASKSSSTIRIHREDGQYIGAVDAQVVYDDYGTIHEYLKQRYGAGRFSVDVPGKDRQEHIAIAGDGDTVGNLPGMPETGQGMNAMDMGQLMGLVYELRATNERLQSELQHAKDDRPNPWSELLPQLVPELIGLIANRPSGGDMGSVAEMLSVTTDTLVKLRQLGGGEDSGSDIGSIISGIAGAFGSMRQQQAAPPMQYAAPPPMPDVAPTHTARRQAQTPQGNSRPLIAQTSPPESPPMQDEEPLMEEETTERAEEFIQDISNMMQQRQSPGLVAEYLMTQVNQISPQEIASLGPEQGAILQQLKLNPAMAFDVIAMVEPALAADTKYADEIKRELQKKQMTK